MTEQPSPPRARDWRRRGTYKGWGRNHTVPRGVLVVLYWVWAPPSPKGGPVSRKAYHRWYYSQPHVKARKAAYARTPARKAAERAWRRANRERLEGTWRRYARERRERKREYDRDRRLSRITVRQARILLDTPRWRWTTLDQQFGTSALAGPGQRFGHAQTVGALRRRGLVEERPDGHGVYFRLTDKGAELKWALLDIIGEGEEGVRAA